MAVKQEMRRTTCGVLLATLAILHLAGASASTSGEHVHGTQRGDPTHRPPALAGKSVINDQLEGDAGLQLRVPVALEILL